ncbi:MAG: hypothetical protein ACI8PZ_006992 [Myxococcota bacterium]|jgi:hypothetical protein
MTVKPLLPGLSGTVLAIASVGLLISCGGKNGGDTSDSAPVTSDFVCDPVGADPVMGGLLNAPLEADVEVVWKEPQHPGAPGPADLP